MEDRDFRDDSLKVHPQSSPQSTLRLPQTPPNHPHRETMHAEKNGELLVTGSIQEYRRLNRDFLTPLQ